MPRPALWTAIAQTLRAELAGGLYPPGSRLPTEAEMAARFGVNRHTVRQALAALAGEGLIHARRGAGVFVTARPTEYPLGERVRFHQNIAASGRTPTRRISRMETRPAQAKEAAALHLPPGAAVHVVEGVSLADGQPLAAFRSVFPAERLPGFLTHFEAEHSVTKALTACGVADYTRASTRITAKLAPALLARTLHLTEGAPVLRSVAINVDASGRTVEFGTTWFAGDRVELTLAGNPA